MKKGLSFFTERLRPTAGWGQAEEPAPLRRSRGTAGRAERLPGQAGAALRAQVGGGGGTTVQARAGAPVALPWGSPSPGGAAAPAEQDGRPSGAAAGRGQRAGEGAQN